MIQFNLLPDIKLEYMRARRTKRTVMFVSSAVSIAALSIFVVLVVGVKVVQRQHIDNLTDDIKVSSTNLRNTENLNEILTIQNQLNSLAGLHEQKVATTRLLDYVRQFTPQNVSISSFDIDYVESTVTVTGAAPTLVDVNRYADTLKFTKFLAEGNTELAFSEVVLSSFGKSDKGASYTITFKYDPGLFDNTKLVLLQVPADTITTRSQDKPELLFEPSQEIEEDQ